MYTCPMIWHFCCNILSQKTCKWRLHELHSRQIANPSSHQLENDHAARGILTQRSPTENRNPKPLLHGSMWVSLKTIMARERSQAPKDTHCVAAFLQSSGTVQANQRWGKLESWFPTMGRKRRIREETLWGDENILNLDRCGYAPIPPTVPSRSVHFIACQFYLQSLKKWNANRLT